MKTYTLECEVITPGSIRDTFRLFEDARNLARITPPWLNFQILTQGLEMKKGAEIDYFFRWFGVPMRWKTVITTYEPPFLFVDEALSSPYKFWRHTHTFRPMEEGTLVSDRVDYALPLGWIGRAVHEIAVRRQLGQIFQYRQKAVVELLGGKALELREPAIV